MGDGTGKNSGRWRKKREGNHFHFFEELLLEYVTVNETGGFGIPPDKGDRAQYFVYIPFLFISNQFWKQAVLTC